MAVSYNAGCIEYPASKRDLVETKKNCHARFLLVPLPRILLDGIIELLQDYWVYNL
jgi:hypothetical protein